MTTISPTQLILIVAGAALFVAVFLLVAGFDSFLTARRNLSRRLIGSGDRPGGQGEQESEGILPEDDMLTGVAEFLTPKDPLELATARRRLERAGYRKPSAVRIYNFAKPVLALALAVVALSITTAVGGGLSPPVQLVIAIAAGMIGFFLPWFWVERRVERRTEEAQLCFPDMLDMLLICIEAGGGIDHATRRVAAEVAGVSPVLAEELAIVNNELWAGKERASVFRDFANRLAVDDISAFVTVLRQSDEFGVSVAEALRVYASDMRLKRITRAEEKANTMPTKVALGSVLFTVPPTMLIMAGPSLYQLSKFFGGH
jgi:tight adherence protein C